MQKNNLITTATHAIDLHQESKQHLLAISFPRSRAASYDAALTIAHQAAKYGEVTIGKQLLHFAVFGRDKTDATRACAILKYIGSIAGLQVYAGGKMLQQTYWVTEVLTCYLNSLACDDWKAHCLVVIDDPLHDSQAQYIYPCALLYERYRSKPVIDHPSAPAQQIQASAVKLGCDWCPRFNENNFKKI